MQVSRRFGELHDEDVLEDAAGVSTDRRQSHEKVLPGEKSGAQSDVDAESERTRQEIEEGPSGAEERERACKESTEEVRFGFPAGLSELLREGFGCRIPRYCWKNVQQDVER